MVPARNAVITYGNGFTDRNGSVSQFTVTLSGIEASKFPVYVPIPQDPSLGVETIVTCGTTCDTGSLLTKLLIRFRERVLK